VPSNVTESRRLPRAPDFVVYGGAPEGTRIGPSVRLEASMNDIPFVRTSTSPAGVVETLSPLVRRIVAPNAGPFTFTGTCTYLVGRGGVAVIDPGPADGGHVEHVLAALRGERVEAILVTHTHLDHSPAAAMLAAATDAPTYGAGPHRASRPPRVGETMRLDASADMAFAPAITLVKGMQVTGAGWTLEPVATPGHCVNHLAFALAEEKTLFSGDHVMGWSTTIVAPPDGAMGDYMASLAKLVGRPERLYLPGHGAPIRAPHAFVRALAQHRRMREAAILARIAAGDDAIPAIVARVYQGLDPVLVVAASLNTLAHLEDLVARGLVEADGEPSLSSRYWVA
jgi:glyoxylase-like metal-dependent hydrolase (beta-lactamase superfamily II)